MAFTLRKGGHKVRVLEKQNDLSTPSSGLRIPPNMSKILKKWVGAEELAKIACLNVATPWYDCEYHPQLLPFRQKSVNVVMSSSQSILCSRNRRIDGFRAMEACSYG